MFLIKELLLNITVFILLFCFRLVDNKTFINLIICWRIRSLNGPPFLST